MLQQGAEAHAWQMDVAAPSRLHRTPAHRFTPEAGVLGAQMLD
jgi:hypothetical protein